MLDRNTFLIKERVGFLKLVDTYDILDPATGATLGTASENVSGPMKALRLLVSKQRPPTKVEVRRLGASRASCSRSGAASFCWIGRAARGKELFTSADNYIITLSDRAKLPPETTALLLAAGLAIDVVYTEK